MTVTKPDRYQAADRWLLGRMRGRAVLHHDSTRLVTREAVGILGEIVARFARGFRRLPRTLQCAHAFDASLARQWRTREPVQQCSQMLGLAAVVAVVTGVHRSLE